MPAAFLVKDDLLPSPVNNGKELMDRILIGCKLERKNGSLPISQ